MDLVENIDLNIIVRPEPQVISKFIVSVPPNGTVKDLKQAICKKTYLEGDMMTIIYGSVCMQDNEPLCAYDIKNDVTINVFKKVTKLDVHDLFNVSVALQSLRMSRQYLQIWNNLKAVPNVMSDIIQNVPELEKDETAQIILKYPSELLKFNTTLSINYLMTKHPSLVPAILYFSKQIFKKIKTFRLVSGYSNVNENENSEDNIIHNSLEFAVPKNMTPFASDTDTASQVELQNHWAGQPQTNTSGNVILSRRYLFSNEAKRTLTPGEMNLCYNLQRMNSLGLMNDIRNSAALKLGNSFKTAVDIVRKYKGMNAGCYITINPLLKDQ